MKLMIRVRTGSGRLPRSPAVSPRSLPAVLGLMLAVAAPGTSQTQISGGWTLGPTLQYGFGVPVAIARDSGIVNRYSSRLPGVSNDHTPAIGIQLRRPILFQLDRPVGLTLDLVIGRSYGSFTSDPFPLGQRLYNPSTVSYVEPNISVEVTSRPWFLRLGGTLDYHWLDFMTVGAGLWGQYRFSSNFVMTERLVDYEAEGVVFTDRPDSGQRSRVVMSGAVLGSSLFRGGPAVTLTFPWRPGRSLEVLPSVTAQLDVGAVLDGLGLRAGRLGAGVALAFALPGSAGDDPADELPLFASPREQVREQTPTLEADIALYSEGAGDSSRASLTVRREIHRRVVPLVPEIYFHRDSASIPDGYALLEPQGARGFSVRDLARSDAAGIYYQLLNILGARLREAPEARIAIEGSVGPGEPRALARRRAEAVRRYLADVWGIGDERMTISAETDGDRRGSDDPRRRSVVITGSDQVIFDPVVTSWIEEEMSLPVVRLVHAVRASSGIRRWALTALHGSTEVARYEGTTLDELRRVNVAFALRSDPAAGALPPLVAELQIEDLTGESAVARAELPLARASGASESGISAEIISALVPPDDGAGELLRGIAGAVHDGANVTVLRTPEREFAERPTARPTITGDEIASRLRALIRARRIDAKVDLLDAPGGEAIGGMAGLAYRGAVSVEIVQRMQASPVRPRP